MAAGQPRCRYLLTPLTRQAVYRGAAFVTNAGRDAAEIAPAPAGAFRRCKFQESPMKNHTRHILRVLLSGAAAGLLLAAAGGAQAQAYVNATVGGELAPGVYGRINIGNAPPPPLIYADPSSSTARPWSCRALRSICMCRPATPRTGASTAPATTPAASRCTLCRSRPHAAARHRAATAATIATGTTITGMGAVAMAKTSTKTSTRKSTEGTAIATERRITVA